MTSITRKKTELHRRLRDLGSCLIAFSGGSDSSFLLAEARKILGNRITAVTIDAPYTLQRELKVALKITEQLGCEHIVISHPIPDAMQYNPTDRCYICKKNFLTVILKRAEELGVKHVIDGTNADDAGEYRPGFRALHELGIQSPLLETGITKQEIREYLLKTANLPALPSDSCLLTRIPHGKKIEETELRRIESAELYLQDIGITDVRVRSHGDIARLEIPKNNRRQLFNEDLLDRIAGELKSIGYAFVTLDLTGYRFGSMDMRIETRGKKG